MKCNFKWYVRFVWIARSFIYRLLIKFKLLLISKTLRLMQPLSLLKNPMKKLFHCSFNAIHWIASSCLVKNIYLKNRRRSTFHKNVCRRLRESVTDPEIQRTGEKLSVLTCRSAFSLFSQCRTAMPLVSVILGSIENIKTVFPNSLNNITVSSFLKINFIIFP